MVECSCKNIHPAFLNAIEKSISNWTAPGSPEQAEMLSSLNAIAKDCGFERDDKGQYTQFPKQDKVLSKIGPYTITQEHDDGDLILETNNFGKVVVTTDGEVFYKKQII